MARTRIFYATDIHGSEECFRKFLAAAKEYRLNVLVLGGDITGKMIIPIVAETETEWTTTFLGERLTMRNETEVQAVEKKIRAIGYYTYRAPRKEAEEIKADQAKVDALFSRLMGESVSSWIMLAEERLKGSGIKCYISPGNDDTFAIDSIIQSSDYVVCPEGKVVMIDDQHEMISCGYSNMTPWKCPRDIPEEELGAKIASMVSQAHDMEGCIFNLHCPPYGTTLDNAPKLDKDLNPSVEPGGGFEMAPAGSTAVRDAIQTHQPLLGLHGHIHESKGTFKLGRTLCLNPGSEYAERILRGVLLDVEGSRVKDFMFTSG
jgi:Icc-related predicted phosphoesterase